MNEREFYLARRGAESATFDRVLAALPVEQFDYKPHERSPSTRDLVWTLMRESRACCELIDTGRVDWKEQAPATDAAQIVADFKSSYQALSDRATTIDAAKWERPVTFLVEGAVFQEPPLGQFLWYLFFDSIHHRGQLSTHIRPSGGKVPSIYGPSGDSAGH